ncbi:MAG TPA: NADH-quinone oxidoreductase subunit K [Coriobacteriia bacterium]|nr:NADH-quinone oxidoreductase subunit K [Coriobacteriia bacterium]
MSLLVLTMGLFCLGLYGVLTRRDLVAVLASVEVMLGSATLFLIGSAATRGPVGPEAGAVEATGVLLVVLAAAKAAVGIALVVSAQRRIGTARADDLTELRG